MSSVFLQGNALSVLKGLPVDFFHCCVTSPPYFGLRRYSGGEEVWDGDPNCQHEWVDSSWKNPNSQGGASPKQDTVRGSHHSDYHSRLTPAGTCRLCGAWKGALGNEPSPELYLRHLVEICRGVRRVLRPDGVFWLNIGDSWAGSWGNYGARRGSQRPLGEKRYDRPAYDDYTERPPTSYRMDGIKPLDMVLIPEQLALVLRADGWYLRSILIWAKGVSLSDEYNGNPMPESVNGWRWERHKVKANKTDHELALQQEADDAGIGRTTAGLNVRGERGEVSGWQDCPGCLKCGRNGGYVLRKGSWRPTDSYEHILMLTKTDSYYCDREAVLEKIAPSTVGRGPVSFGGEKGRNYNPNPEDPNFRNGSEQWGRTYDYQQSNANGGRNLRSVLAVPTRGFSGAHFAVYPPQLIEPLIKAATSEKGCCPSCGSPWARVVDKGFVAHDGETGSQYSTGTTANRLALLRQASREKGREYTSSSRAIGWLPTCQCGIQETESCRVLDPFSGAGTTALVAERLGLSSINIDTSAEYIRLAKTRLVEDEQKRVSRFAKQVERPTRVSVKARGDMQGELFAEEVMPSKQRQKLNTKYPLDY